jgi:hypothetical protein
MDVVLLVSDVILLVSRTKIKTEKASEQYQMVKR